MIWIAALSLIPWIAFLGALGLVFRRPRELPPATDSDTRAHALPSVRIVVPARNEARNIQGCLESLVAQDYPELHIVVVDDRSSDETAHLARSVPGGGESVIEVRDGEDLPEGWFGKPWACWQGAREATEDLILFTDADTRHAPGLLGRAVAALEEDAADAVSLIGSQELGSFWERLLQPQVFTLLGLRYPNLTRPLDRDDAADAIANGQYILVRREAYEAIDGHRAVRREVVEDLRFAQLLTKSGFRLSLRSAEGALSTRMYESLREVVDGWTKNLAVGARQSAGWWGRGALPGIIAFELVAWVLPPAILLGIALTFAAGVAPEAAGMWRAATLWAAGAVVLGLVTWAAVYREFEVSMRYAALFPLGAAMVAWIAFRSGLRGRRRIEWKGRRYRAGRADPGS